VVGDLIDESEKSETSHQQQDDVQVEKSQQSKQQDEQQDQDMN
jgi:hypothetical protein